MMDRFNKKIILIVVCFVALLSIIFIINRNSGFRIVKTTPNIKGHIADSTVAFELVFSKSIANSGFTEGENYTDPSNAIRKVESSDNTLIVHTNNLLTDTDYRFEVFNISSVDGDQHGVINFEFSTEYVGYSELPGDERLLQERFIDSGSEFDPIFEISPYSSLNFEIEAKHANDDDEQYMVILQIKLLLSQADINIGRNEAIATYKKEALDFLKNSGYNPDSYNIQYVVETL